MADGKAVHCSFCLYVLEKALTSSNAARIVPLLERDTLFQRCSARSTFPDHVKTLSLLF